MKKRKKDILSFIIPLLSICLVLFIIIPKAKPLMSKETNKGPENKNITFVAIGDSLTEGVGDTTEEGGYVPLLKKSLLEDTVLENIDTVNYGKKGDTAQQVTDRIATDFAIQKAISSADFITLTVGGNDLMAVITKEITNQLSKDTFIEPSKKYVEDLTELYKMIRQFNSDAPIYQLGIYNPFNLSFTEISEFQEIVSDWDKQANIALGKQKNIHFVEINEELSNGRKDLKGDSSKLEDSDSKSRDELKTKETENNLISKEDNFHPNNLGYQLIANRFKDEIIKTTPEWEVN